MLVPQQVRDKCSQRWRGGGILITGRLGLALAKFGRNILIARLIGAEQFGIAATFVVALAFVELISDLGIEKLVVQDRRGEEPGFVAALQGLVIARAILIAGLLFSLASPIAALFNQPELTWAYQLFALLPLIRGALHLDTYRQERALRFHANILPEISGVAVSLLALWPLSLWLGDFRIVLAVFAIDLLVYAIGTHIMAERRFRIAWDADVLRHSLRFGAPLLASGFLTFLALQGDRIIIANQFSAVDLGLFSAALLLGMTPFLVLSRISNSLFLPLFSELRDDHGALVRRMTRVIASLAFLSVLAVLGAWLVGDLVFALIFGAEFEDGSLFLLPVVMVFACRFARSAITTGSLALGRTTDIMWSNMVRIIALPVAFVWISQHDGTIQDILLIALIGEVTAYILAMALLTLRLKQG